MSLKLYTDKQELFECNIELTGVSLTNSVIRAILEFNDKKILVDGKIKKTASATDGTIADIGQAVIAFPKLKNMPMSQFQNLQADVAALILTEAEKGRIQRDERRAAKEAERKRKQEEKAKANEGLNRLRQRKKND